MNPPPKFFLESRHWLEQDHAISLEQNYAVCQGKNTPFAIAFFGAFLPAMYLHEKRGEKRAKTEYEMVYE